MASPPAFRADLKVGLEGVTAANSSALYQASELGLNALSAVRIARTGDAAPGAGGAKFASFSDPLPGDREHTAFIATLAGGDVDGTNATALYRSINDHTAKTAALALLARTGSEAPGAPGSRIASIRSFGIAGAHSVYFRATLQVGPGRVTAANNTDIWVENSRGELLLLIRTGQPFPSRNIGAVSSFSLLRPTTSYLHHGETNERMRVLSRASGVTATGATKLTFYAVADTGEIPFRGVITAVIP